MPKNPFKQDVHIYTLSRLVYSPAPGWEKLIKSIEEGKKKAFGYYLPMREGVVLFCAKGAKSYDEIRRDVVSRALRMGGMRGARVARDNDSAFQVFVEKFYPKIGKFKRSLLKESQVGIALEGVKLFGTPHFEATDSEGNVRYVFLHAADWGPKDTKAYLQLLTFIIEKKFEGTVSQLWCMNLRTGKTLKFTGSTHIRSRCLDAAKLYTRLARSIPSEG